MTLLRVATILPLLLLVSEIEAAARNVNRCFAVRVDAISASSSDAPQRRRFRRRFSAQEVLDLRFSVWLPARNAAGLVEIKLYTPAGRLYEILQASADPDNGTLRFRRRRTRIVSAHLPVAGSHITRRSLYGKWRALVFLDGNDQRCTRGSKTFFIDP